MKILLTGGAGYIGSHTAVELLDAGYDVVIADNFSNSSPEVVRRIEKITGKTVTVYNVDVADTKALESVFGNNSFDGVIHFAGFKAVGESVKIPLAYYRNNIGCTLTLLETMEKYGVNIIIFSSSATVYGTPKALPLSEDMAVGPCTNPYGSTKLFIEQIITDTAAARKDLTAVLLRYFNPVGAHRSGLIGEMPNGIPNNLMPYISQVAVGKLARLSVFGNDYPTKDGTGVRDYIHVVDLAKGHVAALEYGIKNPGVEVFNLGFDRKGPEGIHWIYYPEREISFYRVGFYDNIFGDPRMSLYVELGRPRGGTPADADATLARVLEDLRRVGVVDGHELVDFHRVVLDPAYVHITEASIRDVREKREALAERGVYSIGRYGAWTYCSIEDNIVEAWELARQLTRA